MLEFLKTNKFKILILLAALLLGMMIYSASRDGVGNIPENLLSMVTTPFQKVTSAVGGFFTDIGDRFANSKQNETENKELKDQIAELKGLLIDYEKLKDENEQLKEISGIKDIYPDFKTTIASVVSRDPNDRFSSFIIDKGTLNGVKVNDPVITKNGLVGIVTKVSPTSARVKTILSPDVHVSVTEITTKELGIVKGDSSYSADGLTKMEIVSNSTKLTAGQTIISAGASGLYPKGLPIGIVTEIKTEGHGMSQYAVINPIEDIENVDTVQIILSFEGQGNQFLDYE